MCTLYNHALAHFDCICEYWSAARRIDIQSVKTYMLILYLYIAYACDWFNDVFLAFDVCRKMNIGKSNPSILIDLTFDLFMILMIDFSIESGFQSHHLGQENQSKFKFPNQQRK